MFGKNQLNHRLKNLAKVTGLFVAVFGVLYTGMASAGKVQSHYQTLLLLLGVQFPNWPQF